MYVSYTLGSPEIYDETLGACLLAVLDKERSYGHRSENASC
jgi:hypothetical protein